jgi:outer membrane protein OmpA-like peptidoglycan-associated protein/tetratricopeptide (TPR) repeat protein
MRLLLFLLMFGLLNSYCYAQKKTSINEIRNVYDEKGDYYFDQKKYKKAIVYYNMAYKKDAANYYSVLRKAEAFTALDLFDQAAESYRIIFETDLHIPNEHRLDYALLLLKNKDIAGFERQIAEYNKIVTEEISGYIGSTEARAKMYKDTRRILVENESVLNTPESEIAPVVVGNNVIFASTRKNLYGSSGNDYYTMFTSSFLDDGRLGRLNMLNKNINSSESEHAVGYDKKNNKLYISRGSSINTGLSAYRSPVPSDKNSAISLVKQNIGGVSNLGHITFNNAGTRMYFVSDATGGSGGLDIYYSDLSEGTWSKPTNLGSAVNTSKDELYPFVRNDSLLYFSSAGHNGLGGLDLYVINLTDENPEVRNLGDEINSPYDDYSLSFTPSGFTGYFCSNRPGGMGEEDIYRLHLLDIKEKYEAYKFKRKTGMESDKINLYMSDGEEYNIGSEDQAGFNFGFQPEEAYKMVIQHENAVASDIMYNTNLTLDERAKKFLSPKPVKRTDIKLESGMRYQFTAGMKPLSNEYKSALKDLSDTYKNTGNTIDLTALAKELQLKEGEIYTIRFEKDTDRPATYKSKEDSRLFIGNQEVPTSGKWFFIVLPLDIEANFNIKTDIEHFKDAFNPKKVGAVKVDDKPVLEEEQVEEFEGFPILVNTENSAEVSKRKVKAKELTIVPGTMYILSLKKPIEGADEDLEIVVPLTKGVKYNLGTEALSESDYNKALTQLNAKQSSANTGELIDISVLSKELDIVSQKNIVFNLIPAAKLSPQAAASRNVLTTLNVDGRKYFVTDRHRLQVNLKLDQTKKVNIQTDLAFVQENFDASTIAVNVDKTSFNAEIKEKEKDIITDPVFDVIVVNFDLNDYAIRPDAKVILQEKVISVLKGDSRLYVTIKGYTDGLGDAEYNKKLSGDRAQSVRDFLSNNGIGEKRIRTFSFGESMSLKPGQKWEDLSEEELKKHRKVEIVIYIPK